MSRNSAPNNTTLRAILDVIEKIPPSFYGQGKGRTLRRLVHIVLAKHANPDGTSIFPSQHTLCRECAGISDRGLRKVLDWLEENNLIRKRPDVHPVYATNQYELIFPTSDRLTEAEQREKDRESAERATTRSRVSSWRAKQRAYRAETEQRAVTVTEQTSVTDERCNGTQRQPVTEHRDIGNGTVERVTEHRDIGNGTNAFLQPSLPSFKPSESTVQPTAPKTRLAGRLGSPTSSDKDNTTANVKLFAGWMSDLIQKRTGERSVPNQREMNLLMRSIGDARPIDVIVGFYKFLARPKGVGGLGAPFAMFAQEWPYLQRDAKEAVGECRSVTELVKELDEDIDWGLYGDSDTQIERTQQLASQLNLSASGQLAAQS